MHLYNVILSNHFQHMHCCLIGVGDTLTDAVVTTAKYRKYGDSQRNALKLVAVTFTKDQFNTMRTHDKHSYGLS